MRMFNLQTDKKKQREPHKGVNEERTVLRKREDMQLRNKGRNSKRKTG